MTVDREVVQRRLRKLDETTRNLRKLADRSLEEFTGDDVTVRAAERWLQIAIQIVLDIGAHLLSAHGVLDWEEYREIPRRLADLGIVPKELGRRLENAAGQRNILVHLYLEVDPDQVYRTIRTDLDAFEEFATCALRSLPTD